MRATRTDNAEMILLAPFYLLAVVAAMAWMVATVPLLFVAVVVLLVPAEVLWFVSPFVGLVSPAAGHKLASFMEPAADALEAVMDFLWKPLARLTSPPSTP